MQSVIHESKHRLSQIDPDAEEPFTFFDTIFLFLYQRGKMLLRDIPQCLAKNTHTHTHTHTHTQAFFSFVSYPTHTNTHTHTQAFFSFVNYPFLYQEV